VSIVVYYKEVEIILSCLNHNLSIYDTHVIPVFKAQLINLMETQAQQNVQ